MRLGLPRQMNNFSNLCVAIHWLKNDIDLKLFAKSGGSYVMIDNDPYHGQ